MQILPFKIFNKKNDPIRGDVYIPDPNRRYPVIILCHDFLESKDRLFLPYLAEMICKKDFIVIKFNFSGSGYGEDPVTITEFSRFENNSFTQELEDLDVVLHQLEAGKICGKAPYTDRLGLWGHGRGGAISILKAASDRRIQTLVTWSAWSHIDRPMFRDSLVHWKRQGFFPIPESLSSIPLQLNHATLNDIEKYADNRLHVLKAAGRLSVPHLLIHAGEDQFVPIKEAHDLKKAAPQSRTQLEIIPNADHRFNVKQPFDGPNPVFKQAFKLSLQWFKTMLRA